MYEVLCPVCGHWEQQGDHDPRWHIKEFKWIEEYVYLCNCGNEAYGEFIKDGVSDVPE